MARFGQVHHNELTSAAGAASPRPRNPPGESRCPPALSQPDQAPGAARRLRLSTAPPGLCALDWLLFRCRQRRSPSVVGRRRRSPRWPAAVMVLTEGRIVASSRPTASPGRWKPDVGCRPPRHPDARRAVGTAARASNRRSAIRDNQRAVDGHLTEARDDIEQARRRHVRTDL